MTPKTENGFFVEELMSVLDMLGPICKHGFLEYLRVNHRVEIAKEAATDNTVALIKKSLKEIFGDSAAALIMKQVDMRLEIQQKNTNKD